MTAHYSDGEIVKVDISKALGASSSARELVGQEVTILSTISDNPDSEYGPLYMVRPENGGDTITLWGDELEQISPALAPIAADSAPNGAIPVTIDKQATNGKRQVKFVQISAVMSEKTNGTILYALDEDGQVWEQSEAGNWALLKSPEVSL